MSFRHYISVIFTVLLTIILVAGAGFAFAAERTPGAYAKIPRSLQTIESEAGDITGLAASGYWRRVSRDMTAISDSWSTYKKTTPDYGVGQGMHRSFESALARLERVSAADNVHQTVQAADDLRAIAADISDFYHPVFPSDIARLDALERQTMLKATTDHLNSVSENLAAAHRLLDELTPSIEAHKGASLARRFQANLAQQSRALQVKDRAALAAHARNALELVNRLETLYS